MFSLNQQIATPKGFVNISDTKIGDKIYTFDTTTSSIKIQPITSIETEYFSHEDGDCLIGIQDKGNPHKYIEVTPDHPVLTYEWETIVPHLPSVKKYNAIPAKNLIHHKNIKFLHIPINSQDFNEFENPAVQLSSEDKLSLLSLYYSTPEMYIGDEEVPYNQWVTLYNPEVIMEMEILLKGLNITTNQFPSTRHSGYGTTYGQGFRYYWNPTQKQLQDFIIEGANQSYYRYLIQYIRRMDIELKEEDRGAFEIIMLLSGFKRTQDGERLTDFDITFVMESENITELRSIKTESGGAFIVRQNDQSIPFII